MRTLTALNIFGKLLETSVSKTVGFNVCFLRWEKTLLKAKPWDFEDSALRTGILPVFTTPQKNLNIGCDNDANNGQVRFGPGYMQVVIISDELLENKNENAVQAVIYHECGHIACNDLITGLVFTRETGTKRKRELGREISADVFAATMPLEPDARKTEIADEVIAYLLEGIEREVDIYEEFVSARIRSHNGEDVEKTFEFFWPVSEELLSSFEEVYRLEDVLKATKRTVDEISMNPKCRVYYDAVTSGKSYMGIDGIIAARRNAVA